jgi:hypothetical protein
MAYNNMTRVEYDVTSEAAIYYNSVSISSGTYSDVYILPYSEITGIVSGIDGDGALEFTADPPDVIRAGNAEFSAWDGSSQINLGVTGYRVQRNSGTVVGKVTVRTAGA